MEGIGTVLGLVALFVALAALWFVSDVVKRFGREHQQFLENHLRPLKDTVDGIGGRLAVLERKAGDAERQLGELQKAGKELRRDVEEHHGRLDALGGELDRLDQTLAANRRTSSGGPRLD